MTFVVEEAAGRLPAGRTPCPERVTYVRVGGSGIDELRGSVREVASLLRLSREVAKMAIDAGIATIAGELVQLRAVMLPTGPDVTEADLDAFIKCVELDEPGRHPPVAIRRELSIESGYRCAVCKGAAPLEFHHIPGWAAIKTPRRATHVSGLLELPREDHAIRATGFNRPGRDLREGEVQGRVRIDQLTRSARARLIGSPAGLPGESAGRISLGATQSAKALLEGVEHRVHPAELVVVVSCVAHEVRHVRPGSMNHLDSATCRSATRSSHS